MTPGGGVGRLRLVASTFSPSAVALSASAPADVPETDDPERLSFDPPQLRSGLKFVLSVLGIVMVKGHLAAQGQQQGQRVLGHFDQAIVGNVGDEDSPLGGGANIDVVQPDAQPGHDAALWRGLNHRSRHLGPIGHDGVDIGGQGGQRIDVLSRGDDQFGVDLGQRLPLDVQIGPGIVGQQHFEFWHGGPEDSARVFMAHAAVS